MCVTLTRVTYGAAAAHPRLDEYSDEELIARLLGGDAPTPSMRATAATVSAIPAWERRLLGAAGLRRRHRVPAGQALRLAALWELAERWQPDDRPAVTSPRDAVLLLGDLRGAAHEQVWVLLLDARHRPIGREVAAVGTINASRLTPRDVLAPALRAGAAAFVVAHNHPSGDPAPSRADRLVTEALRSAATLVGVPMLDHIVLAARGHHSFREVEGWDVASAA